MYSLSDTAKQRLTEVLVQFSQHRNAKASLLAIETIFEYEQSANKPKRSTYGANKKPLPEELTHEQHVEKLKAIFIDKNLIGRSNLIMLLMLSYNVGQNKIEERNGYLQFLRRNGYITPVNLGAQYELGDRCTLTQENTTD